MKKKNYSKAEKRSFFSGLKFGIKKTDKAKKYLNKKEQEYNNPLTKIKFDKNGEPLGDPYMVLLADQNQTLKNIGYYDIDYNAFNEKNYGSKDPIEKRRANNLKVSEADLLIVQQIRKDRLAKGYSDRPKEYYIRKAKGK